MDKPLITEAQQHQGAESRGRDTSPERFSESLSQIRSDRMSATNQLVKIYQHTAMWMQLPAILGSNQRLSL